MTYVPEEHGGAILVRDRDIVERLDCRRHRIGPHRVLRLVDLLRSSREGQVLRIDRIDDLQRRQAFGQQLRLVDIDHELSVFPAGGGRQCDAVDRREHLPQPIYGDIIELCLAELIGTEADLQHGDG